MQETLTSLIGNGPSYETANGAERISFGSLGGSTEIDTLGEKARSPARILAIAEGYNSSAFLATFSSLCRRLGFRVDSSTCGCTAGASGCPFCSFRVAASTVAAGVTDSSFAARLVALRCFFRPPLFGINGGPELRTATARIFCGHVSGDVLVFGKLLHIRLRLSFRLAMRQHGMVARAV